VLEQLKLLLDAAHWRDRIEDATVNYTAYDASRRFIENLQSAIYALEEHAEATKDRPANYDPYAVD